MDATSSNADQLFPDPMDATSSTNADQRGPDPFQALIADGRVGVRPSIPYKDATILTINFENLEKKIQSLLLDAYLNHEPLRKYYYSNGAPDIITSSVITKDIACLARYAVLALYNRLRTVAEFYCPFAASTTMLDAVAYISPHMEFPTFLSSLLSSIGALRIMYGAPRDVLIVYAPADDDDYIKSRINIRLGSHDGDYHRLITNLRLCGVGLSSLDYKHLEGAFWTTCYVSENKYTGLLRVNGTIHPTNYVNEDVVRAMALLDSKDEHPFEDLVGLIIGYTNNAAVVAAVAADVPPTKGVPADEAPRLVGWTYTVNDFGIQPAYSGKPPGVYIVGRGGNTVYTCILAQHLSPGEISSVIRYRLLAPPN